MEKFGANKSFQVLLMILIVLGILSIIFTAYLNWHKVRAAKVSNLLDATKLAKTTNAAGTPTPAGVQTTVDPNADPEGSL